MAVTYTLQNFDARAANNGAFCVVVKSSYTETTISSDNENFLGAGICTTISSSLFSITFNGIIYKFNGLGNSADSNIAYKIYLASTNVSTETTKYYGSAVRRSKAVTTTKDAGGIGTEVTEEENTILLSGLTIRDNFALQALKSIIALVPDIRTIGEAERAYYCKMAYDWAAEMMENAAEVRATFKDDTASSTTSETLVGDLETNTDKLLNNLIVALEKTHHNSDSSSLPTTSESVFISGLIETLGSIKESIDAQTVAINEVRDAINALELSPVINNNITIPSNTEGE